MIYISVGTYFPLNWSHQTHGVTAFRNTQNRQSAKSSTNQVTKIKSQKIHDLVQINMYEALRVHEDLLKVLAVVETCR